MMSRLCLMALVLTWTSSLFAMPCAAYPSGTWSLSKQSASQFEQTWLELLEKKDTAALNCILAPNFADVSRKGQLRSKDQVLRELPQRQQQYQQKLTDLDITLFGDTAVVRGVNVISDSKGAEVLRLRFTDVLLFKDRHWLALAAQETEVAH